jgi:hypothetical protein
MKKPRGPSLGFLRAIPGLRNNLRVSASLTRMSPFPEPRHPRFRLLPEIDPEIAIVSVVSPDASISGYEPVPLAIADKNVMFPFGVGNRTRNFAVGIVGWADGILTKRRRVMGCRCQPILRHSTRLRTTFIRS